MPPLAASARLTGAQKWLREPRSLKANVARCSPRAAAFRYDAVFSGAAAYEATPHRCIRYTIAVDEHRCDTSSSAAAIVRRF